MILIIIVMVLFLIYLKLTFQEILKIKILLKQIKNNITKIKLKDNNLKIKNVSAGLYYLKSGVFF